MLKVCTNCVNGFAPLAVKALQIVADQWGHGPLGCRSIRAQHASSGEERDRLQEWHIFNGVVQTKIHVHFKYNLVNFEYYVGKGVFASHAAKCHLWAITDIHDQSTNEARVPGRSRPAELDSGNAVTSWWTDVKMIWAHVCYSHQTAVAIFSREEFSLVAVFHHDAILIRGSLRSGYNVVSYIPIWVKVHHASPIAWVIEGACGISETAAWAEISWKCVCHHYFCWASTNWKSKISGHPSESSLAVFHCNMCENLRKYFICYL